MHLVDIGFTKTKSVKVFKSEHDHYFQNHGADADVAVSKVNDSVIVCEPHRNVVAIHKKDNGYQGLVVSFNVFSDPAVELINPLMARLSGRDDQTLVVLRENQVSAYTEPPKNTHRHTWRQEWFFNADILESFRCIDTSAEEVFVGSSDASIYVLDSATGSAKRVIYCNPTLNIDNIDPMKFWYNRWNNHFYCIGLGMILVYDSKGLLLTKLDMGGLVDCMDIRQDGRSVIVYSSGELVIV